MFRLKKGKRLKCAIAFNDCNFVTKNLEIFKNHLQCSNEKLQDKSMTLKLDFFSNLIKATLAETPPVGKLKADQNTF